MPTPGAETSTSALLVEKAGCESASSVAATDIASA